MTQATPSVPSPVPRTKFTQERDVFVCLRSNCPVATQKEYELAVQTLVERYNTTIHENRFIVGGAVEMFTYTLLRSAGIECNLHSDQTIANGILLPGNRKLSVASSFNGVRGIRLLNKMGKGKRKWNTATLFVVSGIGIVFGARDMINSSHLNMADDALKLRASGLRALASKPANVFSMEIAKKPPTKRASSSYKASTTIAHQILSETESHDLIRAFPPAGELDGEEDTDDGVT